MPLCQAGNEVRLILAPGAHNQSKPIPLWSGHSLKGRLGRSGSLRERRLPDARTCQRTGFNENYVSRILHLAVLSPEMTEAVFGGDHEPSLTVTQLIANLEIDWTQ